MRWKQGTHEELLALVNMQADLIDVLRACSAQLDVDALLKMVVDEATKLTGASYGAFFHQAPDDKEAFSLYTLSGANPEAFRGFPAVSATKFLGPTFSEGEPVRCGNVMKDARYGHNRFNGPPKGHPPVVSYLAVPVKRDTKIFGGLLFAHSDEDHFTDLHQTAVAAIAAQASVALDNAMLYRTAKEAIEAREDFLSIAAHEIRTPLTPLMLQIQVLRREFERNAAGGHFSDDRSENIVARSLDISNKQVRRLTGLVDELLDVSRIRVGKFNLELEPVDLCEMVQDLCDRWSQTAAESGVLVTVHNCQCTPVRIDRNRIQQVFTNLMVNAIKYAPGSPLDITLQETERAVLVRFTDGGPGIALEDQERIFHRFERANGEFKRGGLGLGLYLSREIVNAHGGSISIKSEPGKGAIFVVALPQQ